MQKIFWSIIVFLLMLPSVKADVYFPILSEIYGHQVMGLIIPIILLEGYILYLLLKKYGVKMSFLHCQLVFLTANIVSSILGLIVSPLLTFGGKGSFTVNSLLMIIPAYFITVIAEFPIIFLFLKKRISNSVVSSILISLLVNVFSYVLIFLWLTSRYLLWQLFYPLINLFF